VSSKVERQKRKALLLSQIQQQSRSSRLAGSDGQLGSRLEHADQPAFLGAGRQQRYGYLDDSPPESAGALGKTRFWHLERLAAGQKHDPKTAAARLIPAPFLLAIRHNARWRYAYRAYVLLLIQ